MYQRHAFSLIELSIVLVILGLLVGGILAGKSLIKASELRAVGTEYQRYLAATHAFRDKYFALPGDMTNAEAFWGKENVICPAPTTNYTPKTVTCNGDGNGLIDNYEPFRTWQQLANAGLIEGQYSGIHGSVSGSHLVPGENVPASHLSNGVWSFTGVSGSNFFTGDYGNHFQVGALNASPFLVNAALIFTPEEAWNLDTKLDDGLPVEGRIIGNVSSAKCTTASSATDYTATYNVTNAGTNPGCWLRFTMTKFTH
jgi:prepilin-type N-terminal cleavage/methylation domain-containing protein